ncbi:MAG: HEAT repeat domain-containing protein [Kiritimatiellae bacterium]|nr:HEAT repeat domain-containing protein [Kiritimatiellia bacterium]
MDYRVLPTELVPDRLIPLFNPALPYAQRMVCLEQVRLQSLDANEAHALLQFLHYSAAQTGMTEEYTHALKNEVANALKQSPIEMDELGSHLMSMAQDEAETDVWRDYCIQHLGSILPALSEHRREVAVPMLWQETRETAGCRAGTAFLALYYNAQRGLVDTPTLKEAVYAAASNPNIKPSVRVTALQVCALLNDTRAVTIARSLLNTDGDAHLKMSALAVLGSQGAPTDIPILNHYAQNSDIRLRTSAQAALEGFL